MKKILIVQGVCPWNCHIERMLTEEGYRVRTTRSVTSVRHLVREEEPDLVMIGLGTQHQYGWHLFRQFKSNYGDLPVLAYHVVGLQTVEDLRRSVATALEDASRIRVHSIRHQMSRRNQPASMLAAI